MKKSSIEPPKKSGSIRQWGSHMICMDMLRLMGLYWILPCLGLTTWCSTPHTLFGHIKALGDDVQDHPTWESQVPFFDYSKWKILGITESHQMITKTSRTWYLNSIISRPWTGDRVQVPRQEFVILWGCSLKLRPYKPFQPVPWGQSMLTMTTCAS